MFGEVEQFCHEFIFDILVDVDAGAGGAFLTLQTTPEDKQALATLSQLEDEDKIEEIARMLGGIDITDKTRAAAREMLEES